MDVDGGFGDERSEWHDADCVKMRCRFGYCEDGMARWRAVTGGLIHPNCGMLDMQV